MPRETESTPGIEPTSAQLEPTTDEQQPTGPETVTPEDAARRFIAAVNRHYFAFRVADEVPELKADAEAAEKAAEAEIATTIRAYYPGTATARDLLARNLANSISPFQLGVNLEEGDYGLFDPENARKYELHELHVTVPINMRINPSPWKDKLFNTWSAEYAALYGEPYDAPGNKDLGIRYMDRYIGAPIGQATPAENH